MMNIVFALFNIPFIDGFSADIVGNSTTVFYGGTSPGSCDDYDLPDAPARAWRTSDGRVRLAAAWATLYISHGASLDNVTHSCDVAFNSTMSGINSLYSDHEWLVAPWLLQDGQTVIGYMHQEYHGWQHKNCSVSPKKHGLQQHCWMVAMTSTISSDGGNTFQHTRQPPGHLVAAAPYPYVPDHSEFGYGDPSGIIKHQTNGYFYMTLHSRRKLSLLESGTCIMRTNDPRDIRSWRGWNGSDFSVSFADPVCTNILPLVFALLHFYF